MLKKNSPGCPCCGVCDACTATETYLVEKDWTEEAGDWAFYSGSPPATTSYAEINDDDALMVRTNSTSEQRAALVWFNYSSGTKADASFYLGMRTADGDSVRAEVSVVKSTGVATCTVYKVESSVETTIDGPQTFTDSRVPTYGVSAGIFCCYQPDKSMFVWGVIGATTSYSIRTCGTVDCTLALRDIIVGTVALNGQVFAVAKTALNGSYLQRSCMCSDAASVKYAPMEFDIEIAGLAASGTKMSKGPDAYGWTFKWLPEWAPDYNATYRLAFDTSYAWTYNYWSESYRYVDTKYVDVDRWKSGAYYDTQTDVEHLTGIQIYVWVYCQDDTTTVEVDILLFDNNFAVGGGFPPFFPDIPRIDDWKWIDSIGDSPTIKFIKTFQGGKDLRDLSEEVIPISSGDCDYLDWSGATVKLTAITA